MTDTTTSQNSTLRIIVIAGLLVAAFFGAYRFASARSGQALPARAGTQATADPNTPRQPASPTVGGGQGSTGAQAASPAGGGCACCNSASAAPTNNGVTGNPVEGTAQLAGGIQAISVKVTTTYSPNVIKLKAGVPAEVTFSQASGCTAQIVSKDLGFAEDVSAGPRVVKLGALKKGTYSFSCGMGMVFGKIVVE